jgi:hypothetical protein
VATSAWELEAAARTMVEGGFRHLIIVDRDGEMGILSIRDLVSGMLESRPAAAASGSD